MKKVLFASTALVAFAGAAAADDNLNIKITGSAEMGIIGGNGIETQFHEDVDVSFDMSGETDNGLTFGVKVDLDEAAGLSATANNGTAAYLSGAFGTITMGDTDGALDWALQDANIGNAGSIDDSETTHAGYNGAYLDGIYDNQILRYDYTAGSFGVAVSLELDDTSGAANVSDGWAIGATYSMAISGGNIGFGIGYQDATVDGTPSGMASATGPFSPAAAGDSIDALGVSLSATLDSGLSAVIGYVSYDHTLAAGGDAGADGDQLYLGVGYTTGAITVSANYGEFDSDTAALDRDGFGLAASYDLGGGAKVHAAYGSGSVGAAPTSSTWSLGVAMSF